MRLTFFVLMIMAAVVARAGVVGKEVEYTADSLTMKGYLAYDDGVQGKRPGVLVVHEWWGHNEYARKRAEMLAELGYVALAVDMYGNGKQASHPDDAGKFAGEVLQNMSVMKARFMAAMDFLKKDEHVDPAQVAAIGYCFGGGVVLTMAREGTDLKAVVSFHGSLATQHPAEKSKVKAKILVCNGADDKFISADDVKKFKSEMKSAGADFHFVNYPGAIHGFTNPGATDLGKKFSMAIAYNENADKKSWAEMQKLFAKVLSKK
ncbi:MAG: dienelactone hydrolase family protein [Ignavibacteriae bacterium]|nr:dienelactone hydrolase family protein [Ignavibacteria bacterium]MBI3363350.1 dienelactone hydrolase family protein [Ignavibacteriota bacterium]